MEEINLAVAFIAGLLSILSPCILPVMPSFLAYIAGTSLEEKEARSKTLFLHTIAFAIGFSLTFLLFGAVIGSIGHFLLLNQAFLQKIGGAIIIILGVHLTGLLKITPLLKEIRLKIPKNAIFNTYIRSFFIGIIFSFGWAPCYGPILGAIFTLAATSGQFGQSILLFAAYALGFLIPLLIMTLFVEKVSHFIRKNPGIYKNSSLISGIIIIILGFLLLTGLISPIVSWINGLYIELNLY